MTTRYVRLEMVANNAASPTEWLATVREVSELAVEDKNTGWCNPSLVNNPHTLGNSPVNQMMAMAKKI